MSLVLWLCEWVSECVCVYYIWICISLSIFIYEIYIYFDLLSQAHSHNRWANDKPSESFCFSLQCYSRRPLSLLCLFYAVCFLIWIWHHSKWKHPSVATDICLWSQLLNNLYQFTIMSIKGDCKIYLHWFSGRLALEHSKNRYGKEEWNGKGRNAEEGEGGGVWETDEMVDDERKREQSEHTKRLAADGCEQKRVVVTDFLMNQINVWLMMAWAVPTSAQSQWMSLYFLDYGYSPILPFATLTPLDVCIFMFFFHFSSFLSQLQWNTTAYTSKRVSMINDFIRNSNLFDSVSTFVVSKFPLTVAVCRLYIMLVCVCVCIRFGCFFPLHIFNAIS